MTIWRKLLVLSAVPALTAAAGPDMMNLLMPDASTVLEINVAKIMASPVGSAIRDAIHQGVTTQLKSELAKNKPELQAQIALLTGIDWSQEVQDIVVARGSGKQPPTLILVRSSLDAKRIQALPAFSGSAAEYAGVPILASSKPESGAAAFLDNSIVVLGQEADVKAAIDRRGGHTVLPAALAAQVTKYKDDDIWVASTETITGPVLPPAAAKSPAGAQVVQFIEKVAGLNGGLRFSPDFDLSVDLEARTEKYAAELSQGMSFLTGQGAHGLEGLKFRVSGKHILVSLHVPEAKMRAGLQQMRTAQAAPVPSPSTGIAPPPAGTIRVQSSDMGTVLLPVAKP